MSSFRIQSTVSLFNFELAEIDEVPRTKGTQETAWTYMHGVVLLRKQIATFGFRNYPCVEGFYFLEILPLGLCLWIGRGGNWQIESYRRPQEFDGAPSNRNQA